MTFSVAMETVKAYDILHRTLLKWGNDLQGRITIEFNSRFTRRAGDAIYRYSQNKGEIRLSSKLWKHMSEDDRRNTIIHEAAHIVVDSDYWNDPVHGWITKPSPHGREWKRLMVLAGENPQRCHNLNAIKLGIKSGYTLHCNNCDTDLYLGKTVARRIMQGKRYRCSRCRTRLDKRELKEVV